MIRIQTAFPLATLASLLWMAGASCSGSAINHKTSEQQASDHAVLSVTYETVMQQVEEIDEKDKDLMRLDIGERISQFRSVIIEWVLDNGLVYGSSTSFNHPFKGYVWLHYQVVKNLPKAGYLYFTHDAISTCDKIEGLFEWELLDGDTTICDYPCKKAKTIFRGRTWTVWYSPLLHYSDGPWKFCGLPGVVLDASEAEGKLAFHCKGIEKDTGYGIFLKKENASPMLRRSSDVLDVYRHERAAELMKLEKYDPKAFLQELHGNINVGNIKSTGTTKVFRDGKEVKTLHHTAILYEK